MIRFLYITRTKRDAKNAITTSLLWFLFIIFTGLIGIFLASDITEYWHSPNKDASFIPQATKI